jgi:hypothetical protein
MSEVAAYLQITLNSATLAAILWGLWRMVLITREARLARVASVAATERAESAANEAARLARVTVAVVERQGINIEELTLNTNSIKDALIASTAKASDLEGEKRGIEIGKAQAADPQKP